MGIDQDGEEKIGHLIRESAEKYGLPPLLVAAVILVESSADRFAFRGELGFQKRYLRVKPVRELPGKFPLSVHDGDEFLLRGISIGLMQIMGQTAREFGFTEPLGELLDPAKNIDLGCKILSTFKQRTGSEDLALLRYNGGSNPTYVSKVKTFMIGLSAKELLK